MSEILKPLYNENLITLLIVDHIPTFSAEENAVIVYPNYTSVTASFSQWNRESQPWLFNCNPGVNYSNLQ